jgi:uracil-DNA glycosylase
MKTEPSILRYQQKCFREYARTLGLPDDYAYPTGNPIRPLPPIQTTAANLMVVGAYPSARFESRPSRGSPSRCRLVPVADNLQPFGQEQYFDGRRVRTLESGAGLDQYLFTPLGMRREAAWITDLVKVFLYKPAHVDSCRDVFPDFRATELRSRFRELALRSLPWLEEECRLCRPKLIVTLGEEVAQAVSGEYNTGADDLLSRDVTEAPSIGGWPVLFLPHPDACRRKEKWRQRMLERIVLARDTLGLK